MIITGHQTYSSSAASSSAALVYSTFTGSFENPSLVESMWSTNAQTQYMNNSFIVPIGSNKMLYLVRIGAKSGRFYLYALCYRRIGTNN